MKKYAWTLAELTVIVIVILVLTKAAMSVTKNINVNQSRIYAYSAIRNITMGSLSIKQKYRKIYPPEAMTKNADSTITTEWYCTQLADAFTLDTSTTNINCNKSATSSTVNFVLGNGIAVMGASSAWKTLYDNFYYKDLLVDIDGTSAGLNKIGVDRFPLRVFSGKNTKMESIDGLVLPVNCQSGYDQITNLTGAAQSLTHAYCSGNNNMALDSEMFAYDVLEVVDPMKTKSARVLTSRRSAIEADCLTNGGRGLYGHAVCKSRGFKLHPKCAHKKTCSGCGDGGTCPNGGTEAQCETLALNNKILVKTKADGTQIKKGYRCVNKLTKPTGGMGMLGGSILGETGI